ncbi:tripartite tricarboxylate transporter TctB family protein [Zafaria sp. Z1313]|uniref:tripartite tricarboxylate transporter TctB family protein n=1 Tax=unclassified Zafaria TaxID=2828765 RepID=UPI002E760EED|nr:tripartite tricarboxylate transporter TctB family protein [Zafaria sp. J156]MEE1620571.1 tripartite tricarboxylate transporter TctB family protein [Zafaria sp. J156]
MTTPATGHVPGMDPEADHAQEHLHPHVEPLVTERPYKLRELIPVAVCIGLGATVIFMAGNIRSGVAAGIGPNFFPTWLGWALVFLGLVLVFVNVLRGVRPGDIPDRVSSWGLIRFAATAVVLIGYLLSWNVLQFWLITLVAFAALTWLYGARGWKPLLLYPVIVTAVLHFLFVVALRVPL